jgi:hypothetical protein
VEASPTNTQRERGRAKAERPEGKSLGESKFMAASAARAFILSRVTDLSLKPLYPHQPTPKAPVLCSRHHHKRRIASVSCLISGVDGGGVSDDFVSTRKSGLDRGFSVIANMLRRIEPLDNSVISKGVSDSAKDSMKQTISTMLGLLPSDQFSVTISVSKRPLHRLLVSSVITGYSISIIVPPILTWANY